MRIVVCIRQGLDGEIGPFDASAYEAALRMPQAEVILLSMGPSSTEALLRRLTRLGAKEAILLSDKAFAGADTLATAYTLSLAIRRLSPDLVLCGRQTLVGDTAQTGPMLGEMIGYHVMTEVMTVEGGEEAVTCFDRTGQQSQLPYPALVTVEKEYTLRLPSLRSKEGSVTVWTASELSPDPDRIGLKGSPTRVIKTFENESGKRKCRFLAPSELSSCIAQALAKTKDGQDEEASGEKLPFVMTVGEAPISFAKTVSEDVRVLPITTAEELCAAIERDRPPVLLFGSDALSKCLAATVAARLSLGLCADCTRLAVEDGAFVMYRPALSGSILAKIKSLTTPALATVRTEDKNIGRIVIGAGYGVRGELSSVRELAERLKATFGVSRKLVDNGFAPYREQVGLTGKSVSPELYLAIGISGAVHHIAGMARAGTVIAVNPDKSAPIFDYADFGVVAEFSEILSEL